MTRSTDRLARLARRGAASLLAAACLTAAPSFAATQAGVSAAVRGDVERSAVETGSVSKVSSGQEIFLGDGIRSGKGSGMQLMLLDQSVFTVGADSELTIDRFVFDPNANAGQITASLGKGVMRFVSGKVARGDPEDMQIKLPVGTVGIRGTFGAMGYDGQNAFVVLLGPGSQNDANANQGRIDVNLGGADFQLTQPGFGVTFTPGAGPQLVRFTPDMLGQMGYSTTGNGDGGGDNGGGDGDNGGGTDQGDGQQGGGLGEGDTSQVKQAANTGIGQAKGTSQQTNLIFQNANTFSTFNTQVATNQTRDLGQQGQLGGTFAPSLVSLTRTADLVAQNSGSVVFAQQGIPFFFGTGGFEGGTFNVSVLVNFAAQQIGGGGSLVRFNGQSVNFAEFLLPGIPFTNGVFNLAEYFISPGQSSGGGVCSSACDAFITLEFFNAGGFRPGLMDVMALLTDGNSGLLASGDEIITGSRVLPSEPQPARAMRTTGTAINAFRMTRLLHAPVRPRPAA